MFYDLGIGVTQDYGEAAKWYRKAADQGVPEAQYNLAVAYSRGRGVRRDYSKAYFWVNIAAALDPTSQLAMVYLHFRDEVAANLSSVRVSAIHKRSRDWLAAIQKRKAAR